MTSPYSHQYYGPPPPPPPPKRRGWVVLLVVALFVLLICCPIGAFVAFEPGRTAEIVRKIGEAFS